MNRAPWLTAALSLSLLVAASCSDADPAPAEAAADVATPSDAVLFPDVVPLDTATLTDATPPADAPPDPDAAPPDPTDAATDSAAPPADTGPPDPCVTAPCTDPHTTCRPDPTAPQGRACDCAVGYAPFAGACVSTSCGAERFRTWLTLYDTTPLPGTANPVRSGFDPLLRGDRVRVVVAFERTLGASPLTVVTQALNLDIDPATLRLDGAPSPLLSAPGPREVRLDLAAAATSGRLAFEGTIPATGPALVALDARAFAPDGCPVDGSASGARLQLAGNLDPKHAGCNNLTDLRSLQLTDAIPDKDTAVYAERNGTFAPLSASYKVLTQMTLCLERKDHRTLSLAGSADGTRPWTIDNFLLIERFATDPSLGPAERTAAWLTTSANATAPGAFADATPITIAKHASLPGDYTGSRTPAPFTFPAGVLQLDALVPVGQRVWLRFTGLDTGVAGHLSRLFITSADLATPPPECRSHLDCPEPTSTNGSAITLRSGCVAGACTPVACGAGCPLGQRCLQGFCTDGCTSDAGCPAGQVCGQSQCVTLALGGCRTFADCPAGEVCFFGRCEPGCFHPVAQNPSYGDNYAPYSLCSASPSACPRCPAPTSRCWFNYCRDCELDAHCAAGQVCADYRCVAAP